MEESKPVVHQHLGRTISIFFLSTTHTPGTQTHIVQQVLTFVFVFYVENILTCYAIMFRYHDVAPAPPYASLIKPHPVFVSTIT